MMISANGKAAVAAIVFVLGMGTQIAAANAQEHREGGGGMSMQREGGMRGNENAMAESFREPRGYARPARPDGAEVRPQNLDRAYLNHNFKADRPVHIGPYHAPQDWRYQRFHIGQVLPPVYWGNQYRLIDYWLFGLDIPPVGYEWVRYGPDALLVDLTTGEVVQSVYDNFM